MRCTKDFDKWHCIAGMNAGRKQRHTGRQTGRATDRKKDRQEDRREERQEGREAERHMVWNREIKKFAFIILVVIAVSFIVTNFSMLIYSDYVRAEYNGFLAAVFGNLLEVYPEVPVEELIRVLENHGNEVQGEIALARYGVFGKYGSDSFDTQERHLLFLHAGVNISLFLIFCVLCIAVYLYLKKRQKRIQALTFYMQALNRKGYKLEIEENEDDELSGLRNEIYKLTVFLKEQANRALAQKQALADSVTNISHQLKTPLTSAIVLIDNLSENPDMDFRTRRHFISEIANQITGMSWLLTVMMKLSRLDAGVVELQGSRFEIGPFVEEILGRLEIAAELKQLSFSVEMPEGAVLYADRKWTAEALLNLVKNAIEHSPAGSFVKISCEDNEVYTQIVVRDYGAGITREEQEKLFRRFYNGNSAREDSMGIGLALAKEIVEKQGGYISVDSRMGKGTVFLIRFVK